MQAEKTLRDYCAAHAKEYDAIYAKPERQPDLRKIERWLPPLLSGKRVLEVACGTGYWTQFYAPQAERVVAPDAAQETLEIAARRRKTKGVDFRKVDAYALPDQLGLFDAAFAGFWLSHVPHKKLRPFLKGLHTRLAPQSQVIFLDNLYIQGSSTPIINRDEDGNTYQKRRLSEGTEHCVLKNFPSEGDLTRMIEGLGTKTRYRKFEYYWAFSYETGRA